jgi:hypothetical protein
LFPFLEAFVSGYRALVFHLLAATVHVAFDDSTAFVLLTVARAAIQDHAAAQEHHATGEGKQYFRCKSTHQKREFNDDLV